MKNQDNIIYLQISPNFPDNYYKFSKALKENGVTVLGLGDEYPEKISKDLLENLDDYKQCLLLSDTHYMINTVQSFINKYGRIDWIESNNEYWLEQDSTLREWFNIRTGVFHNNIKMYKAKSTMKFYFARAGVKVSDYTLSGVLSDSLAFAKRVGYPLFAKPNVGVGAMDTYMIENEEQLRDFYLNSNKNIQYILEQYIDGKIVSYDGITNSKGKVILESSFTFLVNNSDLVNNNLDDCYYCEKKVPDALQKIGRKIVKQFNIVSRCFHIEFFILNKDYHKLGKKGDYVALEVNMRPAGAYSPDMISLALDMDYYKVYADMVAYDKNRQKQTKNSAYAVSSSRRDRFIYKYTLEEILDKYKGNIVQYGRYDEAISDDQGDSYILAKFTNKKTVKEFDKMVREKRETTE